MQSQLNTSQENAALKQAKELLEKAQEAHVASSKNVVQDITKTLMQLYNQFAAGSNVPEENLSKFSAALTENPELRSVMQPLLVAASAIHARTGQAAVAHSNEALKAATSKLGLLQDQLASARQMQSVTVGAAAVRAPSAVQPNWTPVAAAPAMAAPPAAMAVEVAASGANALPRFVIPDVLKQGMPSFADAGANRVTNALFSRPPK